ncbi:MAG: hypothetical protein QG622_2553, partial [Actinomycetota bacterium]|nr:hypothetical protein [Actinomycetota bacterium]
TGDTAPTAPAGGARSTGRSRHAVLGGRQLPAPPRPPSGRPRPRLVPVTPATVPLPAPPGGRSGPPSGRSTVSGTSSATAGSAAVRELSLAAAPSSARTFGPANSTTKTLVLYDTGGEYGWLGELYALAGGTLASHFGSVTAEPVTSYVAGQIADHTATVYLGSSYNEALPAALIKDVTTTAKPVVWAGFNVWQLAGAPGSATATAFRAKYGWDPSTSYLTGDVISTITYKNRSLTRAGASAGSLLAPYVTSPAKVTVLANAVCASTCDPLAQTTGTTFPWAIRSSNLAYVGEIPFSYLSERDRYLAFADLLFPALRPGAGTTRKAAVRLEDVTPVSDPAVLRQFADYLSAQKVPFTVAVVPEYRDPTGVYNGGTARTVTLAQAPAVVAALTYLTTKGGTIIQHGYTHQYSTIKNPYNGVTGDDFEFYRSRCSATQNPPYQFGDCQQNSWVILEGSLPGDTQAKAKTTVATGRSRFTQAGLAAPTVFETPHYTSSAADYRGMKEVYGTRYERDLFFGGLLNPSGNATRVFGQFFPYAVTDVYGSKVLPENLGNYEPEMSNNHPPRLAADLVNNAAANLVVTEATASLFYHPAYPLSELQKVVTGIKGLGFTFVAATSL